MKRFDLDSPFAVASEILSIYDLLKQAMFELFGGHSQFALSLKEGFSKSFQSLDEVTGVRVRSKGIWVTMSSKVAVRSKVIGVNDEKFCVEIIDCERRANSV